MKQLIDIDDKEKAICEQYINGKRGDELGDYINITELAEAIANGIPYEPKGDLISRSALKEQFNHLEMVTNNSSLIEQAEYKMLMTCISLIDNAPTVEPCYQTTSCLDCKNYDKETHNCPRYCEVIKEAIKSRPKGEWIVSGLDYQCSNCGMVPCFRQDNFCPNCGAKMKGGKE